MKKRQRVPRPSAISASQRSAIGAVICAARKRAGWSTADLAHHLGQSSSSVEGYESGRTAPGLRASLLICRALGISLAEIEHLAAPKPGDQGAHVDHQDCDGVA